MLSSLSILYATSVLSQGPGLEHPYPPTGDSLCKLYNEGKRSFLTEIGLSNHMRHTLELQLVGCQLSSALDHTVDVTKNYSLPGAKTCFDVSVETGKIATVAASLGG
jgi:hypothetical protein